MKDKADGTVTRVEPQKKRGGRWIVFGEEEYQVPPLAFRTVIDLQDDVESLRDMGPKPTAAQMDTVTRIVHAALVRNYPDMTKEAVADMLDVGNFQEVINATLAIGGFKEQAGGPPSGEVMASTGMAPTAH
jgi:hypothetical protein